MTDGPTTGDIIVSDPVGPVRTRSDGLTVQTREQIVGPRRDDDQEGVRQGEGLHPGHSQP